MLCLELHGIRSGICTRFGCATASCTCSEKPLPWGLGGILSILKLVAVSEYSRDQRLSSRITVYRSAGRSELFDHVCASKSLSRTPSGTLSGNSSMAADLGTGFSLLTPCNVFAKTESEAPVPLNTTFNLVSRVYIK